MLLTCCQPSIFSPIFLLLVCRRDCQMVWSIKLISSLLIPHCSTCFLNCLLVVAISCPHYHIQHSRFCCWKFSMAEVEIELVNYISCSNSQCCIFNRGWCSELKFPSVRFITMNRNVLRQKRHLGFEQMTTKFNAVWDWGISGLFLHFIQSPSFIFLQCQVAQFYNSDVSVPPSNVEC